MQVVVALGGNVGDRAATLRAARDALATDASITVLDASPVYETEPLTLPGSEPQARYLNAALLVETSLDPEALLERCLDVERQLGRVRRERWGPRTLDLDLLWADEAGHEVRRDSASLTLPHPHLAERSFALAPLLDMRPDLAPRYGEALIRAGGRPRRVPVEGWTSSFRRQ